MENKITTTIAKKNTIITIAFFLCIFIYKIIHGIQGLNIYDEGFQLVGFDNIIEDPESVQYQFLYYLGFLCGGSWNLLFGEFSIFGLRILSALVETLTFFVVYKILKDVIKTRFIFIGIAILLITYGSTTIFNHNILTSLLNILASFLIYKSFINNNVKQILVAGIIIGINVYVRIPNLAMVGLILTLIPFYLYNRDIKETGKYLLSAILGFILGNCVVWLIMLLLDHTGYMVEVITGQLSGNNDSSHNISHIFKTYIDMDYIPLLKDIALFSITPLIILSSSLISNKYINHILFCISILLLYIVLFINDNYILFLNSFSTAILCISIIYFRNNSKIVYLSSLGLLIAYLQPMGGDFGFPNMEVKSVYLSFTLSLGLAIKIISSLKYITTIKNYLYAALIVFCMFLTYKGVKRAIFHIKWYPTQPLWTMTYNPDLDNVNILIDESTGKELEELAAALNKYVNRGDYLFSIDACPISHYISHTKPYLYNPLVWCYSSNELKKRLAQAEKERQELPVVLLEKNSKFYYSYINQTFTLPDSYLNINKRNKI